jgi:hypothetical protein
LDEGIAVSRLHPYDHEKIEAALGENRRLVDKAEAPFWLEMRSWSVDTPLSLPAADQLWFIPLQGQGAIDGHAWQEGECWLAPDSSLITCADTASALVAAIAKKG